MQIFIRLSLLAALIGTSSMIFADDAKSVEITKEAAIGGGVGGALGGAIGAELGDRKGAIIGAAVGAAIGATIATEGATVTSESTQVKIHPAVVVQIVADPHPKGHHCPPGQRKKGRC